MAWTEHPPLSYPRAVFAIGFDLFDRWILRHRFQRVCHIAFDLYPDDHPITVWATKRLSGDD